MITGGDLDTALSRQCQGRHRIVSGCTSLSDRDLRKARLGPSDAAAAAAVGDDEESLGRPTLNTYSLYQRNLRRRSSLKI